MHFRMNISKAMKTKLSLLFLSLCIPFLALAQKDNKALLAGQFLKSGNYTKASQLYSNLYNTHKSTNYYQGLLNCYLALNNIQEAEKLVKKHSKKYSKNSSVLVDYAHILTLKGEERKAQKKFDQVFEQLEINEQFVGITANKLTKYQYLEMAIKAYEIGLRNPSKGSFRFQMARIYGQLGDIEMMYENYLTLIITNKAYLQSVKTTLGRTVNNDPENENNQLLKALLLKNVQQYNDENINDLLIWLFIQEKNFEAAFDQEKALDQRLGLDQKKVFELASICRKNRAFNTAPKLLQLHSRIRDNIYLLFRRSTCHTPSAKRSFGNLFRNSASGVVRLRS